MKFSPLLVLSFLMGAAHADFFRNDYLPVGHVRTDAILNKDCLSDHVHTFYGPPLLYPGVTYDDLRKSDPKLSSGNIEENLSLYWHPSVYRVAADGKKTLQEPEMTTVYYIWIPGQTTAFPKDFRMITPGASVLDVGVTEGQQEMELNIRFPSCWKGGNNLDTIDQSHVEFPMGEEDDAPCPPSHPVRLPRLDFFIRFFNTEPGRWEFADGTTVFHADYISGWEPTFLQSILDGGDGDAQFTFRAGLEHQGDDLAFRQSMKANAVPPADTSCISTETIDNIVNLPRGSCSGTLISPFGVCGPAPNSSAQPTPAPTLRPTTGPKSPTPSPTLRPTTGPKSPTSTPTLRPTLRPTLLPTQPISTPSPTAAHGQQCSNKGAYCEDHDQCCGGDGGFCILSKCVAEEFCQEPGQVCVRDSDCCNHERGCGDDGTCMEEEEEEEEEEEH